MKRRAFLRLLGGGAAALATAPLLPFVAAPKPKTAPTMRFVRSFEVQATMPARVDVLYGFSQLRPEYICRVIA